MRPRALFSGASAFRGVCRAGVQSGPEGDSHLQHHPSLLPLAFSCWEEASADLPAPARWLLSNYISYYETVR